MFVAQVQLPQLAPVFVKESPPSTFSKRQAGEKPLIAGVLKLHATVLPVSCLIVVKVRTALSKKMLEGQTAQGIAAAPVAKEMAPVTQ